MARGPILRLGLAASVLGGASLIAPLPALGQAWVGTLHQTRVGMKNFYENPLDMATGLGGFVNLTGVPYDPPSLDCQNCHWVLAQDGTPVPSKAPHDPTCTDCHTAGIGSPVDDPTCLGCHSRQNAERGLLTDVHASAGLKCQDCHGYEEFHDGANVGRQSLLEPGAIQAKCSNCHANAAAAHSEVPGLAGHLESLDCSACHVESVVTCMSCHFESEADANVTRFFGPPPHTGFRMLINREGKVHSGTFMSATWTRQMPNPDTAFYVLAPYTAHSIKSGADVDCGECHRNQNVRDYDQGGTMQVTRWDAASGRLLGPEGVVPVPPDWQTALLFDFATYDGMSADPPLPPMGDWSFLKSGADLVDFPYGAPLTADQMDALINVPEPGASLLTRAALAALGLLAAARRSR